MRFNGRIEHEKDSAKMVPKLLSDDQKEHLKVLHLDFLQCISMNHIC